MRVAGITEVTSAKAPRRSHTPRPSARDLARELPAIGEGIRHGDTDLVAFPSPSYAFYANPRRARHRGCTLYATAPEGDVVSVTVEVEDLAAGAQLTYRLVEVHDAAPKDGIVSIVLPSARRFARIVSGGGERDNAARPPRTAHHLNRLRRPETSERPAHRTAR